MTGLLFMLIGLILFVALGDYLLVISGLLLGTFGAVFLFLGAKSESWGYLSCGLGVDTPSNLMVILSSWVVGMSLLASYKVCKKVGQVSSFLALMLGILIFLWLSFMVLDLLMFYISFEMVLIPMVILVFGFGGQPERLQAGVYMLFYTMFGSLPLLVGLLYLKEGLGGLTTPHITNKMGVWDTDLWGFVVLGFLIKLPVYLTHLWLPKAHVEAPVSGSMILAGVLLKLGGYGLLRVAPILMESMAKMSGYLVSLGLLGGLTASLLCSRQSDMKKLVAYSSVGHMGLFLAGVSTFSHLGVSGGLLMMMCHGLTSSGLFSSVNELYEASHSRMLLLNRGLMGIFPSFMMVWFLLCASNMAAPPFLNLAGELFLGMSIISFSMSALVVLGAFFFVGAVYNLYLYSVSAHGVISEVYSFGGSQVSAFLLGFHHLWPLLAMVMLLESFFW